LLTALVRTLALVLRVTGQALRQASRVLIRLYDVAIVVPLLAERIVKGSRRSGRRRGARLASTTPSARTPKGDAMDRRKFLLSTLALAASGCSDPRSHRNAVYMLVDTPARTRGRRTRRC